MGGGPLIPVRSILPLNRALATSTLLDLVPIGDARGHRVLARFFRAVLSPHVGAPAAAQAAGDVRTWARGSLSGAARTRVENDVASRMAAKVSPGLTGAARQVEAAVARQLTADLLVSERTVAHVERAIGSRMTWLSRSGVSEERAAGLLHQTLEANAGRGPEGLGRLYRFIASNLEGVGVLGTDLRKGLERLNQTTDIAARRALASQLARGPSGFRWPIRGRAGEIWLGGWQPWIDTRHLVLREAELAKTLMRGGGWEAFPVSGDIYVNGALCWDDAILVAHFERGQAALLAAGQMKVARNVQVARQTFNDAIRREAVVGGELPVIDMVYNEELLRFEMVPLPPEITPHRFMFYAEGGALPPTHITRLHEIGIDPVLTPVPVSVRDFDNYAVYLIFEMAELVKFLP